MIEFALVSPILFSFMLGTAEYGRFVMTRQLVQNAAREGARQAAANSPFVYNAGSGTFSPNTLTTANIQTTVINYLVGQPLLNSSGNPLATTDVSVYRANPVTGAPMTDSKGSAWTSASFGEAIAVSMSVRYKAMVPGLHFLTPQTPIKYICMMRSEASQ